MVARKQQPIFSYEFHPLSIARVLWKARWRILFLWPVLTLIGVLVVRQLPTVYQAEAVVLVDSQKIPERFVASTVQIVLQDQLAAIKQQILSSAKLQKIIDDFQLYKRERTTKSSEEIILQMRKDVDITMEKGWSGSRPGAFRITFQGEVPTVVASVVNQIAGLFINENLKNRELRAEGTSEFIDSQLESARKKLEELERALGAYKIQRSGELPQQEAAIASTLARLQTELQGHQDGINRDEQNLMMLENALHIAEASVATLQRASKPDTADNERVATGRPTSPGAPAVARRSERLQAELATLRLRYSDEHPTIQRLKAELERTLKDEERTPNRVSAVTGPEEPVEAAAARPSANAVAAQQVSVELNREQERISTLKLQLTLLRKNIETRQAERQRILLSIGSYQNRLERLPLREQEMASLMRDYEISKQHYASVLEKSISAEMSTAMERRQQAERFTLLDPARVPTKPVKPKLPLLYGLAAFASLCISAFLPVASELKKNSVLGEWELPADVKILGRISVIRPQLLSAEQPQDKGLVSGWSGS